jgi:uncharacterized membrane protein
MMFGFGLLVLLLLGGLFVALLQGGNALFNRSGGIDLSGLSGQKQQPPARQVLDERLARGEISPEEYEAIRARIGQ